MTPLKLMSDSVHLYMNELTSRVVAETGIPSDRFHLGKTILQSMKDAPDHVMQIDGATGQSETFRSVLERAVQCSTCLTNFGLKQGDVIVLMAPNHLDLAVPLYAGLFLGIPVAALDATLEVMELESMFKSNQAKIIFCETERVPNIQQALNNIKLNATIVTFNEGSDCITFSKFMDEYGEGADVENFKTADFDPTLTIALLVSTSGTTGLPKCASLTHKNLMHSLTYFWSGFHSFPSPVSLALVSSPLHWLTAGIHYLISPVMKYTRLQSSKPLTQEHFVELVNKYRPNYITTSPTLITSLIKPGSRDKIDITCFDFILMGGSAVSPELMEAIHAISPKTNLRGLYGMSEVGGLAFMDDFPLPGSMGRPMGIFDYRLVDIDTREDIDKPHVSGELWMRGPSICKGYYNNLEATRDAFEEGGWFRTGDIFYRDEYYFFYFVDRLKLLLKYRNHQISPFELEAVIRENPGVLDVAVTGIPDPEAGDLAVACVVPRSGHKPTAQEIKDLVKNKLTDSKQLRGGVIFMEALPVLTSTKVNRRKLKELVLTLDRE